MNYKKANQASKLVMRACLIVGAMCLAIALGIIWEVI